MTMQIEVDRAALVKALTPVAALVGCLVVLALVGAFALGWWLG